jgi:hypothetical protein
LLPAKNEINRVGKQGDTHNQGMHDEGEKCLAFPAQDESNILLHGSEKPIQKKFTHPICWQNGSGTRKIATGGPLHSTAFSTVAADAIYS